MQDRPNLFFETIDHAILPKVRGKAASKEIFKISLRDIPRGEDLASGFLHALNTEVYGFPFSIEKDIHHFSELLNHKQLIDHKFIHLQIKILNPQKGDVKDFVDKVLLKQFYNGKCKFNSQGIITVAIKYNPRGRRLKFLSQRKQRTSNFLARTFKENPVVSTIPHLECIKAEELKAWVSNFNDGYALPKVQKLFGNKACIDMYEAENKIKQLTSYG